MSAHQWTEELFTNKGDEHKCTLEKNNKALLKYKVVLLPTAQEHSTIHAEGSFSDFIRDLFLTPWSLGTWRSCVSATWLCGETQSGSLATKIIKKQAGMINHWVMGRRNKHSSPRTHTQSYLHRMVPHASLLWIFVVVIWFLSYIITGRTLLAEIV